MAAEDIFRCVACGKGKLNASSFSCQNCATSYTNSQGILDTLINPHEEVIKEMKGMARERGLPLEDWPAIKIIYTERIATQDELVASTQDDPVAYYQQTLKSFNQAFEIVKAMAPKKVLEVGADAGFNFLKRFREIGSECFALNLHFDLAPEFRNWPHKILGDMNDLPFCDDSFDLVLLSATSHHSPDLERTVREVSRVLKVGGVALFLNDQISGWFKIIKDGGHSRDQLIHENYYSIRRYDRAFRKNHFSTRYLFSDFFDEKLRGAKIHPQTRFATLARLVSVFWRVPLIRAFCKRFLLWPAHVVFGFPLNVILRKQSP